MIVITNQIQTKFRVYNTHTYIFNGRNKVMKHTNVLLLLMKVNAHQWKWSDNLLLEN